MNEEQEKVYITEQEAESFKQLFKRSLKSYKEKDENVTDEEWLNQLFQKELPEQSVEVCKEDAANIVNSILKKSYIEAANRQAFRQKALPST